MSLPPSGAPASASPGSGDRPGGAAPARRHDVADDISVGDVVRLRKGHPCGDDLWRVVRIGAEVGLRCVGCGRKVELVRRTFGQRFKERLPRGHADVAAGAARSGPDGP